MFLELAEVESPPVDPLQKNGPISGARSKEANGRKSQGRHSKVPLPLKERLGSDREESKTRFKLISCEASFLIRWNLHLLNQNGTMNALSAQACKALRQNGLRLF